MNKRTMDELISYFNQEVSKMDISQENKMKLLGMITAIGYENKKQDVVRCRECKYYQAYTESGVTKGYGFCVVHGMSPSVEEFYCADGEEKNNDG